MENNNNLFLNKLISEKHNNIDVLISSYNETEYYLREKIYDYFKHMLQYVVPMKTMALAGLNIFVFTKPINDIRLDEYDEIIVHFQDETDTINFKNIPFNIQLDIFNEHQRYISA